MRKFLNLYGSNKNLRTLKLFLIDSTICEDTPRTRQHVEMCLCVRIHPGASEVT